MKRDFNLWLASLGPGAPVKTLTELRNYNVANQNRGAIKYGQAQFDISDEMLELAREQLVTIAQAEPYAPIYAQLTGGPAFALAS